MSGEHSDDSGDAIANKPHWLCRFGWHRWAAWSEPEKVGVYRVQQRFCARCNILDRRTL